MERIRDGSLEVPGVPDWLVFPGGAITDSYGAVDGVMAAAQYGFRSGGFSPSSQSGALIQTDIPLLPGILHAWQYYIWANTVPPVNGAPYQVDLDPGDGAWMTLDVVPAFQTVTWEERSGTFTALGDFGIWNCGVKAATGQSGLYITDLFSIQDLGSMAKRSRWTAHQALVAALKGITLANGYHLDVGNRVYSRLWVPGESAELSMPYICVPLYGDLPRWQDDDTHFLLRWNLNVHCFVSEQKFDSLDSTAVRDAYYLVEDVAKAVLGSQTLGGACQAVRMVDGGGALAGVDVGMYGEAVIPLELTLHLGVDVLGA